MRGSFSPAIRKSSLHAGLLVLIVAFLTGSVAQSQDTLIFGVRADAPPFSYNAAPPVGIADFAIAGTPRENGFKGYVVDLCNAVLDALADKRRLDLKVQTRLVNASNRFDLLRAGEVHILCDPATIMPDRLESNAVGLSGSGATRYLNVSVPVYMSAVTLARPRDLPGGAAPCRILVSAVGETTAAPRGIDRILAEGNFGRWTSDISIAMDRVRNGEPSQIIFDNATDCEPKPAFKAFPTHAELADAFCAGEVLYYVGDIEIIRSLLTSNGCLDRSVIAPATFTDERYGIYTALPNNGILSSAILTFLAELSFQVHSQQKLLDVTYKEAFKEFQPSQKLRAFFWSVTGSFPSTP
ncbi:Bacterial extracellular solute-binding proteins, family 3 [Roseovarius albus]|uniref:Bacterial extracellular solute-binding proteins, family 3 n=1 Tax=Roseovarius albus TaxID=1247867 RepID=A0A1X7A5N3_9RHOB|nr:transporter substrate-binding domain-containing protein [Roseovarius albus]SLN70876.1 Bacterial extracellular solute-binding proteins, family 3 [Roseovarius albus]